MEGLGVSIATVGIRTYVERDTRMAGTKRKYVTSFKLEYAYNEACFC